MDDLIQANLELRAELEKANNNLSECQNEVKRLNTALDNCIDDSQMLKTALADQSDESKSIIHRLEESLEGAQAEIDGKVSEIFLLESMCDNLDLQLRNRINQVEEKDRYIRELNIQLEELIGVSERVERNSDVLLRESKQVCKNLKMAN
jgi:chromosome segregation ATPase